jgi:5-methyltetrahydropteroyltriglutamate--homocysteine methyltransferase
MPSKPNYRAEQVGSLLRSEELLKARNSFAERSIAEEQFRDVEDRAIRDALQRQRDAGMDILSDGEFRRGSWLTDMAEAVEGFVADRVFMDWKGPGGAAEASTANAVGGKLRKHRNLTALELPFLRQEARGPFKVTLPAPSNFMVSSYKPGLTDRFYASRAALLQDLVEIIREEIQWLVAQGAVYIQLDAPYYSHYLDPQHREQMLSEHRDPDRELADGIAADNTALEGIPRDTVTVAAHICRGNSRSRWFTEGGYDLIAEKLFGSLDADRFLLEFDTERSGTFEPLRSVPRGKHVVLGLITTKEPTLESKDVLRRRIDDAAKRVPIEYLAISPQCGFASVADGNLLTMDDQWRKLDLVVEVARKVWG